MGSVEDGPSQQSYWTTGLMGIIIFGTILVINTMAFRHRRKYSAFFLSFFSCVSMVCILELPRYVMLLVHRRYTSQWAYAIHITASYLFCLCLTMIVQLWSTFVELGPIETKIYSKVALVVFNVLFLALVLTSVVFCVTAESLDGFFKSVTFSAFIITELLVYFMYTVCLGFLSVKLVRRFHRYANNASTKTMKNNRSVQKDNDISVGFKEVLYKVLFSFTILVSCSIIRLGMLVIRLQDNFMDKLFIVYGSYWFLWTDFIPRGLALVTLIFLMFYKPIRLTAPFSSRHSASPTVRDSDACSNTTTSPQYRDDVEEEGGDEWGGDTENPLRVRPKSTKRNSVEMTASGSLPGQSLMTDFFGDSENFDMELERAMEVP